MRKGHSRLAFEILILGVVYVKSYLTVDASFTCNSSQKVKFSCLESANKKVKYKGKIVLTDSAKLVGQGICEPLTLAAQGNPIPCRCSLKGWILADDVSKICGRALLTEGSKNFCMATAAPIPITVKKSGTDGKFFHGN